MQLVANAIIYSAIVMLVAVGFQLIFRANQFFHFAHGIVISYGGYFTYWLLRASIPLIYAILLSVLLSAILGFAIQLFVYNSLRDRSAAPSALLLSSLGTYVVLLNIVSLISGDATLSIRSVEVKEGLSILGANITPIQIFTIIISACLTAVVGAMVQITSLGKVIRAVSSDPILAKVAGINVEHTILWVSSLGSALAGIAGILMALDVSMTPFMGMNVLMASVVAVIVGGRESILGVALGSLLLGLAQNFGIWKIGSQWQDASMFVVLLAFLLLRPQGFLGRKIRKSTV